MAKPSIRNLVTDLAATLREEVLPHLGAHAGRAHSGEAEGGDVTFAIDEHAETRMEGYLAERAPEVAFYSEDRGMVSPEGDRAEWVLVVDPIDGTRPALAGLESCCVSVAAARLDGEPTMGDVQVGCVMRAEERPGSSSPSGAAGLEPAGNLSANRAVERMFWTYGFRGRPARALVEVLAELIDSVLGRRRHLRPRLGHLRHDPDRNRAARRVRRARAADHRRHPGDAGGVRARRGRCGAQQLPL